jgi:lipopolysaccharide transport system permease protein
MPASDDDITVLEPHASARRYLREVWVYRELFVVLAQRDVLVRYKQTFFGVVWALIRPLTTTLVFAFAFGKVARLPSGGVPYPLFVLAGTLLFQLFASALGEAGNSLVANANIVSKTYFPRMIVPASSMIVSLVDLTISAVLLGLLMAWYGIPVGWPVLLAPLFVALTALVSFGAALWIAALNVRFRDVRHLIPFVVQLGLFVSPVGYASSVVPDAIRPLYRFNPLVAPIEGFRFCLFGTLPPDFRTSLMVSIGTGIVLLVSGYLYFKQTESTFADVI